jgi:hypothetical protein
MANGEGWGANIGSLLRGGGPWALALAAVIGVVVMAVLPSARADPFTGSQAAQMREELEKQIKAVSDLLATHVAMPHHYATAEVLAAMRTDQKHILETLCRVETALQKTTEVADGLRTVLTDHEARIRSLEKDK